MSTLPVWISIAGASLVLLNKRGGFWTLLVGAFLSLAGNSFGYIPFVPWFNWGAIAGFVAMHIANLCVVGLIGYFLLVSKQRKGV